MELISMILLLFISSNLYFMIYLMYVHESTKQSLLVSKEFKLDNTQEEFK
jgi:hypothetical protein